MNKNTIVVLGVLFTGGCRLGVDIATPPMDSSRMVSERDCARSFDSDGGNLKCADVSEAERRAKIEEEERLAREKKEAAARAERERLERERAEQLAREEEARRQKAAAEAALAAEAARKAEEERQRLAKIEAEARAKREAALAECARLEQERQDGRAVLEGFVSNYGKVNDFKGVAGQINTFLGQSPKSKPCPSA